MLLAVLQLPVDVVKHQQLTPAILQQLHLVTHLKQSRSSTADTHHAAVHSIHSVPGRHPTGGVSPGVSMESWNFTPERGTMGWRRGDGHMALLSWLQSSSTCFRGTCWLLSASVFPHQAQPPQITHKF